MPSANLQAALSLLQTLGGFGDLSGRLQVECIVHALTSSPGAVGALPADIRDVYDNLRVSPYGRISQYLSEGCRKAGRRKPRFLRIRDGYRLEAAVAGEVARLFGRPGAAVVHKTLQDLTGRLTDRDSSNYLDEALRCYANGLFRGSIVMTLCLTYHLFRAWIIDHHLAALNSHMACWKNPVRVSAVEDFQKLSERQVIDAGGAAGFVNKELCKSLVQCLDERNSHGHPSGKAATAAIAEAFIERCVLHIIGELK